MFRVTGLAAAPQLRVRVPSCTPGLCKNVSCQGCRVEPGQTCVGREREGLGDGVAASIHLSLCFIQKSNLSEDMDVVQVV